MAIKKYLLGVATIALMATLSGVSAAWAAGDTTEPESADVESAASAEDDLENSVKSQTPEPQIPESQTPASRALSKLQIHGFLTQGYAETTFVDRPPLPDGSPAGPTFEEVSLGIPEDGTTNYRNLAIQFRYEISSDDFMVIQFSSRALGVSPIQSLEDEIELDWAFYEHRFDTGTSIKIGRVQIPYGIFNEVRDVGTILPFYRPAFVFYREGSFTTETVDGLLLSHTFLSRTDWALETDFYAGEWDSFDLDPFGGVAVASRNEDSFGTALWLNTPLSGLRLGTGFQRRNTTGGAEGVVREVGAKTVFDDYWTSIDAAFTKFVFRGEFRSFRSERAPFPAFGSPDFQATFDTFYLQLGYHPMEKFRVYLQWESTRAQNDTVVFTEPSDVENREDIGIALNYVFQPSVVLKAEFHEVTGEQLGVMPVPLPVPPFFRLAPFAVPLDNGDYFIISLSASF